MIEALLNMEKIEISDKIQKYGPVIKHFDVMYHIELNKEEKFSICYRRFKNKDIFYYCAPGCNIYNGFEKEKKYLEYLVEDLKILEKYKNLRFYASYYIKANIAKFNSLNINQIYDKILAGQVLRDELYLESHEYIAWLVFCSIFKKPEYIGFFAEYFDRIEYKDCVEEEYWCLLIQNVPHIKFILNQGSINKYTLLRTFDFKLKYFEKTDFKNYNTDLAQYYYDRQKLCENFKIKQIPLSFDEILKKKVSVAKPVYSLYLLLCLKRRKIQIYKWLRIEICKYF